MAKSTTTKTSAAKSTAAKTTKAAAKTTVRRASTVKSAAAKSAVKASPKPVVVKESTPMVADPAMKKKELIDTVTERSGVKRKDVKPVVEAMLAILGQSLADGRELNLQPLGKIKVNRAKEVQGGSVLITKVRQSNRVPTGPKDPVAEAAE